MSENKNKRGNEINNDDYSLIFGDELNPNNIKEKQMKSKTYAMIGSTVLFFVIMIVFVQFNGTSNADYIGGNVLRLAIGNGEESDEQTFVNPWVEATLPTKLTFRSLFESNKTFVDVNPSLASKCEELDDGLTYVITLKDGEKWSDGTPITVDDVVFSFESFLLCDGVDPNMQFAFNLIKGVDEWQNGTADSISGISVDGNKIKFELLEKYNLFDIMLTQFVPLPKHILGDLDPSTITNDIDFFKNENLVSSGMYYSTGLDADKNLVLEHNPHYKDAKSDIEKIILYWNYKFQEIDYYSTTVVSDMASYRSIKELQEYPINVYTYHYFAFNTLGGYTDLSDEELKSDDRPLNDPITDAKVRHAINHAIDIEKLFQDIYLGSGLRCYGGSMTMSQEVYEYNPTKAKQLLEEAEYDFNRPFKIMYYIDDTNTQVFLQKVSEYLGEISLNVELIKADNEKDIYQTRDYDMLHKTLTTFNVEGWYNEYLSYNDDMTQLYQADKEMQDKINAMNNTVDGPTYISYLGEIVEMEQASLFKMPMFIIDQAVFIDTTRVNIPQDMEFPNIQYRAAIRFDEWSIKKGN